MLLIQLNMWGAVASSDYSDMFRNRIAIYGLTFLSICDPLYLLATLEDKVNVELRPRTAADAQGGSIHATSCFSTAIRWTCRVEHMERHRFRKHLASLYDP